MVNLSAANKARIEASAQYVETHKVYQLFEGLLADVLVKKPADPVSHLIAALKSTAPPRVVITGPPSSDTRTQCELISARLGLMHVYGPDLCRESANAGSALGLKAKAAADSSTTGAVPDDMMLDLLKEKLGSSDCVRNGWVLEGYPTTAMQARAMLAAGLLPSRVLVLQLEDNEVKRRLDGRRVDSENNAVYHLEDSPPPDEATLERLRQREDDKPEQASLRLAAYRQSAAAVLPHFRKVLAELDGSLKQEVLYGAIEPLVTHEMPSRAPRGCARVVLLGGPGSRSEELAEELAAAYGVCLVSAPALLHALSIKPGSVTGAQVKPYIDLGQAALVPDAVVNQIVLERLQAEDVRQSGFVLHGYPANSRQAAWLTRHGVWVRHAVHLEMSNEAAKRRLKGLKVDPADGKQYHPDSSWPADPAVQARLEPVPHSDDRHVKKQLAKWRELYPALAKQYAQQLTTVDASGDTLSLVEKLQDCFIVKA